MQERAFASDTIEIIWDTVVNDVLGDKEVDGLVIQNLKTGEDRIVVHRPHPGPETGRATVRDIAAFLEAIGVRPK